LQPRTTSLATPTATLPVEISAEDDYGIRRVQLYRSLNDSRPMPMDVPIEAGQTPRRVREMVYLPLSEYGLSPGDVIKMFGRVEDNDPAGAKGAESTVVTVHIISQAEFERMLRAREGLNVLMSRYRQAQRRMESLKEEVKGLRKKVKEQPADKEVAKQLRKKMDELLAQMRREAGEIRTAAQHPLPFDIDQNLKKELERLAKTLEDEADRLERLLKQQQGLTNEQLAELLKHLGDRLGKGSDLFDEMAMMPLGNRSHPM